MRRAQTRNCSIAAARNVSPAASITVRPSALNLAASLPIVVVLPEPLTPTTRMTNGCLPASIASGRATGSSARSTSAARIALTSSGVDALLVAPARDRLADAGRRAEAEIGLDQDVLELVERSGVELALGEDVGDAAPDARSTSARGRPRGAGASSASARDGAAATARPAIGAGASRSSRRAAAPPQPARPAGPPNQRRMQAGFRFLVVVLAQRVHPFGRRLRGRGPRLAYLCPHDAGRNKSAPALSRWIDAGHRQAGGRRRPSRARRAARASRTISTPCDSACRASPRSRIGSTATPPAASCSDAIIKRWKNWGSCSSRARSRKTYWAVVAGAPEAESGRDRPGPRPARRQARLVDEGRSEGPARADALARQRARRMARRADRVAGTRAADRAHPPIAGPLRLPGLADPRRRDLWRGAPTLRCNCWRARSSCRCRRPSRRSRSRRPPRRTCWRRSRPAASRAIRRASSRSRRLSERETGAGPQPRPTRRSGRSRGDPARRRL